jgi:hypothetical protein
MTPRFNKRSFNTQSTVLLAEHLHCLEGMVAVLIQDLHSLISLCKACLCGGEQCLGKTLSSAVHTGNTKRSPMMADDWAAGRMVASCLAGIAGL